MKRTITCSDGTWNMPGDTYKGQIVRTNVQKIFEAICNEDSKGITQVKYYDEGVGVEGSKLRRLIDGLTGSGLDENILDAYKFISWNYSQGDEVYLFGFSRGAYTARSLVGLIRNAGLVKNNDLKLFQKAYEIYRDRLNPRKHPDGDIARAFRERYSQPEFRIKFIGVWDTVGSLGVPVMFFRNRRKYEFHDTTLSRNVDFAYQALAVDEKRKSFQPAIWSQNNRALDLGVKQILEQVWFAGVHSNIGGGYPDEGVSDIALKWMVEKSKHAGLAFEETYLQQQLDDKLDSTLYNSFVFPFSILGKFKRTVLREVNSNESIHPSVYIRLGNDDFYQPDNSPR